MFDNFNLIKLKTLRGDLLSPKGLSDRLELDQNNFGEKTNRNGRELEI